MRYPNGWILGFVFAISTAGALAAAPPAEVRFVVGQPIVASGPASIEFDVHVLEPGLHFGDVLEIQFPPCSPYPAHRWTNPTLAADSAGYVSASPGLKLALSPPTRRSPCNSELLGQLTAVGFPPAIHAKIEKEMPPGSSVWIRYGRSNGANAAARAQSFPEASAAFDAVLVRAGTSDPIPLAVVGAGVEVLPAKARHLLLSGPSDVRVGGPVEVRAAALDEWGMSAAQFPPNTRIEAEHESGLRLLPEGTSPSPHICARMVTFKFTQAGVWWIRATTLDPENGAAPAILAVWDLPVVAHVELPEEQLAWGDLHWHSNASDGSRAPEAGYEYGKYVSGLDFTARLDHDAVGLFQCIDEHRWREYVALANAWNDPPRFIALLGYEYTSGLGDRSVYFRGDDGTLLSADKYPSLEDFWAQLRPGEVVTIPHHPVGGNVAPSVNWSFHDPRFQRAVEIFSTHGDAECFSTPLAAIPKKPGNRKLALREGNVQVALSSGIDLSFLASTDNHFAAPGSPIRLGNTEIPAGPGLCAAWLAERSRGALFDAIMHGGTYGTTGPRIRVELHPEYDAESHLQSVRGFVVGADDLAELTWVGVRSDSSGVLPELAHLEGGALQGNESRRVARFEWDIPGEAKDCRSVYLRVVQADGERAWGSPIAMRLDREKTAATSGP